MDVDRKTVGMKYTIPLVNELGTTIGYGDRWLTDRTKDSPDGPILGQKHVGITIACLDPNGKFMVQHRRHKIFDKVWSLSGDTHPRKYEGRKVETLSEAARMLKVLLRELLKWTRFSGIEKVKSVLVATLMDDQQRSAYQASDGSRGPREVAVIAGYTK